ncbi:MAG: Rod shape-determining protein MreB [candidate division WS2 bacterium ADurb.Bin280]|uniref:Cell shape-determining protein MreB n=1 Tax=candidate division WS2 bacterium ADurb.Bin280 TaxID=1852829 RepID=A0A1V5SF67_9BACT|nr:MAG: Rod shape-determining protein MreB [candidate division WS2 bacterium ADurb.Bin280]
MPYRIGIDLGSLNIRICTSKKALVVDEPSVVAIDVSKQKVVAVGKEAKSMLGRTPEGLMAAHPLCDGVIASFKTTKQMLQIYFAQILGRLRLLKPDVVVNIPVGATSTEKKAVIDVIEAVGGKKAYLFKSPLAAALGAGIDISSSSGNMVIDVGGGKTEIAVISLGDIVSFSSVRYGGKKFDEAIADYVRKKHSLVIGEQTAEQVKIEIGSAMPLKKELKMEVSGSNTVSGLPESLILETQDVVNAIKPVINEIILSVKQVLQRTPPELSSDIMDRGMVIVGGAGNLRNFDELLTKVTGVPCQMAENPDGCTIAGIKLAVDHFDDFSSSFIWRSK